MDSIPILCINRDISFDPNTLEKMIFLNMKAGKTGRNLKRFSDLVNQALSDFFDVKFPELKIERYVDMDTEASKKRLEKMQEDQARERENQRLLQLAKLRIMEREIEKIKEEEKKSGKKIEPPTDIKRKLFYYGI